MIYLLMFASSTLLFYLSGKCRGALRAAVTGIALLLPCLLAALRDLSIGTDVMTYGIWTYQAASNASLPAFLESYAEISPLGFNLMSWLVAAITRSFEFYLGFIQFLTVLPVYLTARRLFPNREWICMLCYFLLLYPMSLNMMKQSIAAAICLFSTVYAFERKPLYYILTIGAACLFHQTAFVAAITYPVLVAIIGSGGSKTLFGRWRPLVLVAAASISLAMVFLFGRQLVLFFSQFRDSYSYQADHIGRGGTIESVIVVALLSTAVWWLCRNLIIGREPYIASPPDKPTQKATTAYDFFFSLFLLGCILMQLDAVADSVGRLGYYFLPYAGLFISALAFDSDKHCWSVVHFLLVVLTCYFIFTFFLRGGAEIYPYVTFDGRVLP